MCSFRTLLALLVLSISCFAQSDFAALEDQHTRDVAQNPPGVTLTVAVDGPTAYHLSDVIRFKLAFASKQPRRYTADLAWGANSAASSVDFVMQAPDGTVPFHSPPFLSVCCQYNRRYLSQRPLTARVGFTVNYFRRQATLPFYLTKLTPGDYEFFVQTRSVMRGWPKPGHNQSPSNLVVTSSNVLHITILPDTPAGNNDKH
ncbi:MAG: hypothetical protein WAU58_01605 [Terriglobales bacterium]